MRVLLGRFAVGVLLLSTNVACSSSGGAASVGSTTTIVATAGAVTTSAAVTTSTTVTSSHWASYLDEVLDVVEADAYFANRVDFNAWHQRIDERSAASSISYFEMLQLSGEILVDLGDHHSGRLSAGEYAQLNARMDDSVLATPPPTGKLLPGGVGYLTIPPVTAGVGSGAYDSYVTHAHQVLQLPACGWIIDLRDNGGGSVPPMIAAVAPLLGPGTFLGYIKRDRTVFGYQTTDSTVTTAADTDLDPSTTPTGANATLLNTAPVAILTGERTASAAEGVVVGFIGRALTRSFGASTSGVPTGNSTIELSDGSVLNLTTTITIDRLGGTHDGPIAPDVAVTPNTTAAGDDTVTAATAWLSQQPSCQTQS